MILRRARRREGDEKDLSHEEPICSSMINFPTESAGVQKIAYGVVPFK